MIKVKNDDIGRRKDEEKLKLVELSAICVMHLKQGEEKTHTQKLSTKNADK